MPSRFQTVTISVLSLFLSVGCSDDAPTEPVETPGLTIVSGNGQSGIAGQELDDPLIIRVTTESGEPVEGASVAWTVTTGGGSADPGPLTTDANGEAQSEWRLGSALGEQTLSVTAAGRTSVFLATAVDTRAPEMIVPVSGENQTGTPGGQLLNPLVVRVENEFGRPVPGVEVEWNVEQGGGMISPTTTTTDADGRAQANWNLGFSIGQQSSVAGVAGLSTSARFRATAR